MTKNGSLFTKDLKSKTITVVRAFDAPLKQVWEAWTKSEILDHWWAPQPYHAETKTMDFREGGRWLYCMVGPEGDRTWCRFDYKTIEPHKSFSGASMFCDEQGNETPDFPVMYWNNQFSQADGGTTVTMEISFDKTADMEMILKMGFQEGFTAALGNLDRYLLSH
jgi:uncharacterized protein YndB with AHSA1/START domain